MLLCAALLMTAKLGNISKEKKTKGQRDKETKRQRDKATKKQRDKKQGDKETGITQLDLTLLALT